MYKLRNEPDLEEIEKQLKEETKGWEANRPLREDYKEEDKGEES